MANNLLQTLITVMSNANPSGYFLNKQFDIYGWAQKLFQDIEARRSSVTAITREQAQSLNQNNLAFSAGKHESRINTLYRLIGLPSELDLPKQFALSNDSGKDITNAADLAKTLLQREYEQLQLTFKQFLESKSLQDLNAQLDSTEKQDLQLIAQLFDPNNLQKHTSRLFPILQYSQVQNVVETGNKIAPPFASNEDRYIENRLIDPPFLESVITIRLLPQSGGTTNQTGIVEDTIVNSLGYALGEIVKRYHINQQKAEKLLTDGVATIRAKYSGVNSAAVKKGDINANQREDDGLKTEIDLRNDYSTQQSDLYEAIVSLLPLDNDIIPISNVVNETPFQSRNIKNNALTSSFIGIINANLDSINRSVDNNKKVMQKRQLVQDKLNAELNSIIGEIGGISLAEIVIVISALFVIDEEYLIGLISKQRFDQLIAATNNNTTTSSSTINNNAQTDTATKQLNIFDVLKQFQSTRKDTTDALKNLQDTVKAIYDAFVFQLSQAHMLEIITNNT